MIQKLAKLCRVKTNIVFDFDKTIAQMEIDWSGWHDGVSKIYDQYEKDHGYVKGKDPHRYYNSLALKHGDKLIKEIQKFVSDYEQDNIKGFTPFPDLVELIKCNKHNVLHIYSSNARRTVENGLRELGILDSFTQIITRDDVNLIKPNPEGFFLLKDFSETKDDYLMVGDSNGDEEVARSTGVEFLKCTYFEAYTFK